MQFSTKEDIEAPIDFVFQRVTDFAAFERAALRRGMDVARQDRNPGLAEGAHWKAAFTFRGKSRTADVMVAKLDPPNEMQVAFISGGIEGVSQIELVPLSRSRTRLSVVIEMFPRSITARLLLQSLKLAKASLTAKFKGRVAGFAADIEEKFRVGA